MNTNTESRLTELRSLLNLAARKADRLDANLDTKAVGQVHVLMNVARELIDEIRGQKPYVCAVCDEGFDTPAAYRSHLAVRHATGPYICSCGKPFEYRSWFLRHQKQAGHGAIAESAEAIAEIAKSEGAEGSELAQDAAKLPPGPAVLQPDKLKTIVKNNNQ